MLRLRRCGCPSSQPINLRCPSATPTNCPRNYHSYLRCENIGVKLHSLRSQLNLNPPRHWRRNTSGELAEAEPEINSWACIVLLVVTTILGLSQPNSYVQFPPLVSCVPSPIPPKPVSSVLASQAEATTERVSLAVSFTSVMTCMINPRRWACTFLRCDLLYRYHPRHLVLYPHEPGPLLPHAVGSGHPA